MRIFHLATAADWRAAQASGRYTTSTRGRTLAEEGFIHAARADQWQGVRERYYSDVTEPLVLLVVDTERLDAPVVEEEAVPGSGETFPHVYGAIAPSAVVQVLPVGSAADDAGPVADRPRESFSRVFLGEVMHQAVLASVVLVAVMVGIAVGIVVDASWSPLAGALLGLVVGLVAARILHRRRDPRATVRG